MEGRVEAMAYDQPGGGHSQLSTRWRKVPRRGRMAGMSQWQPHQRLGRAEGGRRGGGGVGDKGKFKLEVSRS